MYAVKLVSSFYRDMCTYNFQIYTHITRQQMINTRSNGPMGHPTHKSKCYNTLTVQEHKYTHTHARTHAVCCCYCCCSIVILAFF